MIKLKPHSMACVYIQLFIWFNKNLGPKVEFCLRKCHFVLWSADNTFTKTFPQFIHFWMATTSNLPDGVCPPANGRERLLVACAEPEKRGKTLRGDYGPRAQMLLTLITLKNEKNGDTTTRPNEPQ